MCSRIRVCVCAYMRPCAGIRRFCMFRLGPARSTKPQRAGVQPIFLHAGLGGKSAHLPLLAWCAGLGPACSQVPREKSRATTSTSPEIKVCLWASVMIGCALGGWESVQLYHISFFPFFSLCLLLFICGRILPCDMFAHVQIKLRSTNFSILFSHVNFAFFLKVRLVSETRRTLE